MADFPLERALESVRVGTDLVEVADVRAAIAAFGSRYLDRVYTEREQADCRKVAVDPAPHLAARFAAKEAFLKVLRPSREDALPLRDIETRRSPGGWCELELHGRAKAAAERAGLSGFRMSLSNEANYATALVVAFESPWSAARGDTRTPSRPEGASIEHE
ncbi:MAG TPA: holo-ACP synthase [Polyangiaceae bacterium]|nr:holo-ACP synthase [Polyangiaceae bacterium]